MNTGKLTDVLIEDIQFYDPRTGLPQPIRSIRVYADSGMLQIIRDIPGVRAVYNCLPSEIEYEAYLDPRYDLEWVKAEIEAQIKIHGTL